MIDLLNFRLFYPFIFDLFILMLTNTVTDEQTMPGYQTKCEPITIADIALKIVSLKDKTQFYDPDGKAEKLGISSAMWPISGLIWPSSMVLAKIIHKLDLMELRILEVGCGIGIASLVAAYKKADITASDYHPIVEGLLIQNTAANKLCTIKYITGNWNHPLGNDGKFDLIIGSDLLYEGHYGELLSRFIDFHLDKNGKVILIDPGRRTAKKISTSMQNIGYHCNTMRLDAEGNEKKNGYFTQYTFSRNREESR